MLVAALLPAAAVAGVSFALPGITSDGQSLHTRWHDGLVFGAVLVGGAVAAALLERVPPPAPTRALKRAALAVAALAVVAALVGRRARGGACVALVHELGAGDEPDGHAASARRPRTTAGSGGSRPGTASQHHRLAGTGAGSFQLTNLRYRTSYLDQTIEPHNLPLQFLSEAGIVGLLLFAAAAFALLARGRRRAGPELALALILPAYLLHALVDVDWDFAAVSVPAFLAAGAVAGRAVPQRRASGFAVLAAAGAAVLAFGALLLPWLGARWANDALFASPARAVTLAKRAHSVDPFLVEPFWAQAFAASARGRQRQAFAYYLGATRRQPANPQTWLFAGRYALRSGCPQLAYPLLERFTELMNQQARPSEGGSDYRRALTLVNSGTARC